MPNSNRFEDPGLATLKEIGAELGLSPATVSRALNGFPEVNVKTRDKVREAANRLGYRPNRVAQRLVTGRSGMVGMIVKIRQDMSADQTFFEMLTGLTAALAARDVDLVLAVDQEADPLVAYRKMLERDVLDGFVLNAPAHDDPRVAFLRENDIPFVLHGQSGDAVDYPCFGIDNQKVSADAVRLLTGLGHTRIALLNGKVNYAYAADRLEGFRTAMADAGLGAVDGFVGENAETESEGYLQALDMLSARDQARPTAFVCASTLIAAGVIRAVKDRGLRVPQDVSVVAHDDALPQLRAISFDPALTVTRAPLRDACAPLANLLVDHLAGAPPVQQITRAEMIVRQSTGPAPIEERTPWP
ncbi:LacI family DNA-binding transcriptional regulator [Yoonia sp. SS1-5]|uniref:LacI family DNA-binding transcriptional regulator n=1 Tax=Yoonia rhodophyticola TaxID=3137370 RepID=A0AAN0NK50_9RHOB